MRFTRLTAIGFLAATLVVVGAGCPKKGEDAMQTKQADINREVVPTVAANDQTIEGGSVMIESAVVTGPSWITIHADVSGAPGDVIGQTAIPTGTSNDVRVTIDPAKGTRELYAMLHVDRGAIGTYEFPGVDEPLSYKENIVMVSFSATTAALEKPTPAATQPAPVQPAPTQPAPAPTQTTPPAAEPPVSQPPAPEPVTQAEKTFNITAKSFSFEPSTITVKKGDKVTLNITSVDVTHGFSLSAFGVSETLAPNTTKTVTFTADKTGSFSFFCSVFCGSGHGSMKGTLVVTE